MLAAPRLRPRFAAPLGSRAIADLTRAARTLLKTMSVSQRVTMAVVERLINFPPLFNQARIAARKRIADRGAEIGVFMEDAMATAGPAEQRPDKLAQVTDPSVTLPDYYQRPFHAYIEGNLSWEAALEVELASRAVHATVMDDANVAVQPDGDEQMRDSYHRAAADLLADAGASALAEAERVVDLGCAVGLSSLAAARAFPKASVEGIEASPYFVAVAQDVLARACSDGKSNAERVSICHGLAEATGAPDGSADVVTMCLVMHELPARVSREVMREAFRVLRPGGALLMMEMDPRLPCWKDKLANPFAYAAFKATEPWLEDYIKLDVEGSMAEAGFEKVAAQQNTPTHSTFVGLKPAAA